MSTTPSKARSKRKQGDIEDLVTWDTPAVHKFRQDLLAWYDTNHRILPWRRTPHSRRPATETADGAPLDVDQQQLIYWVWVCEVMSQQTQLERVKDYWRRWTTQWPTVRDLAAADEEAVNQMWAGLGYYRRARYLLQGARHVEDVLHGRLPTTSAELQAIPGVGAYTGNAIASIACGQRVAVMDANVIRVVSRLFTVTGDPSQRAVLDRLNGAAAALLDPDRPGDFNQAMMELGAVVCLGNGAEPKCEACPLASHCAAFQELRAYLEKGGHRADEAAPAVTRFPEKAAKKAKREEHVAVCVVQRRDTPSTPLAQHALLLAKRPEQGLLAGLWEFPSAPVPAEASHEDRRRAIDALLAELGMDGKVGGAWRVVHRRDTGSVVHVFSHIRMTLHVEHLLVEGAADGGDGKPPCGREVCWVTHGALCQGTHKLSGAPSKVFAMVNKQDEAKRKGTNKGSAKENAGPRITAFFKAAADAKQ